MADPKRERALVLLSGGFDSAVATLWALREFDRVDTIVIDSGENAVELEFRALLLRGLREQFPHLVSGLGDDFVLPLPGLLEITKLPVAPAVRRREWSRDLTSTAVYGRNLIFLTLAASVAARQQISDLVIGTYGLQSSWKADHPASYRACERALTEALEADFKIHAPLANIGTTKETRKIPAWEMVLEAGGEELVGFFRDTTFGCWRADGKTKAEWGFGCGKCTNCRLRAAAYHAIRERMAPANSGSDAQDRGAIDGR